MMRERFILTITFFLLMPWGAQAELAEVENCEIVLRADADILPLSAMERFQRLFSAVLERQLISDDECSAFSAALHRGDLLNPLSEQRAQTDIAKIRFYQAFAELISKQDIDLDQLRHWVEARLQRQRVHQRRQQQTQESTRSPLRRMKFARIARGSFEFEEGTFENGIDAAPLHTDIDKDFEIQTTPITQWQWAFVAAHSEILRERLRVGYNKMLDIHLDPLNPSQFSYGSESRELEIARHVIRLQPNHPVENVSFRDGEAYCDQLNEWSEKDDPRIYELIQDHIRYARYMLPGYKQWQYVYKNRGRSHSKFPWGDDLEQSSDHGWFGENSGLKTHEVAQLRPLVIDQQEIFDLLGNVTIWVHSTAKNTPYVPIGSHWSGAWLGIGRLPTGWNPKAHVHYIGLRLVRVLP